MSNYLCNGFAKVCEGSKMCECPYALTKCFIPQEEFDFGKSEY